MFAVLETHPVAFLLAIAILGLTIGSFLNVVIHRLPIMMKRAWADECHEWLKENSQTNDAEGEGSGKPYNLIVPRSQCSACGHQITARENVPVISYLVLRGRCAACRASISLQYPLIEILTAILSLIVAWHYGYAWHTVGALLFTWVLIALAVIDFHTQLLPDSITLPMLWLGLLGNVGGLFVDLQSSVLGAACGYLSLWCVYHLFKFLAGKEGMGYGDFKLLAMLGAWGGWQILPLVILLSSVAGAAVGIGLIVIKGRDRNVPIPFGPYLAIAGWIAFLWGPKITQIYLQHVL
ncbi:MAG TPA: A24 family peptidase [Gammaproteobacteria bacterium]|nr:A24 family peptidase [Gammaproteobacteria bacterium]